MKKAMLAMLSLAVLAPIGCNPREEKREELREEQKDVREEQQDVRQKAQDIREDARQEGQTGQGGLFEEEQSENTRIAPYE